VFVRLATLTLSIALFSSSALAQSRPSASVSSTSAAHFDATPGWALAITGAVLVVGGIGVLVWGEVDRGLVQSPHDGATWASVSDAYRQTPILEAVGVAALIGGVTLGAAGLFRALIGPARASSTQIALIPGGVVLEGRF
jgi:hypothetical protein